MSITSTSKRVVALHNPQTPNNVGPGTYDPTAKHTRLRSAISQEIPFGSTTRRELFNLPDNYDVGPGCYEPQFIVKGAAPKTDFSLSSKREYFVDHEKTPSPADYSNLSQWIKEKPSEPSKWLHPSRARSAADESRRGLPTGLGDNTVNRDADVSESNFGRKIEKQETDLFIRPRNYKTSLTPKANPGSRCADFSRSRAPQREPVMYNGIPGPASYETQVEITVKKGKSPAFFPTTKDSIWSGEVNHNETMVSHTPWCDVQQDKRAFGSGAKREIAFFNPNTPGVGQYETTKGMRVKSSQKSGFGASRPNNRSDTPGPGFYNVDGSDSMAAAASRRAASATGRPAGSTAKRGELFEIVDTPAPNQYDYTIPDTIRRKETLRQGSPAFKDKSQRSDIVNSAVSPGPAYNTRPKSSAKTTIGKANRFTDSTYIGGVKIPDDPSPDLYNMSRDSQIRGGVISRNAHVDREGENTPGPGRYKNLRQDLTKPSYNVMFNPSLQKVRPYM